jgi:hypothetical protein
MLAVHTTARLLEPATSRMISFLASFGVALAVVRAATMPKTPH